MLVYDGVPLLYTIWKVMEGILFHHAYQAYHFPSIICHPRDIDQI